MKYFECKTCGNVMVLFEDAGVIPVCCGKTMDELSPQCVDNGKEKHVPVVERKDNVVTVTVGEVLHPMTDEHYIKWIVLETDKGKYIRTLKPGVDPIVKFCLCEDEKPLMAYEFCNLHSLWADKYEKE